MLTLDNYPTIYMNHTTIQIVVPDTSPDIWTTIVLPIGIVFLSSITGVIIWYYQRTSEIKNNHYEQTRNRLQKKIEIFWRLTLLLMKFNVLKRRYFAFRQGRLTVDKTPDDIPPESQRDVFTDFMSLQSSGTSIDVHVNPSNSKHKKAGINLTQSLCNDYLCPDIERMIARSEIKTCEKTTNDTNTPIFMVSDTIQNNIDSDLSQSNDKPISRNSLPVLNPLEEAALIIDQLMLKTIIEIQLCYTTNIHIIEPDQQLIDTFLQLDRFGTLYLILREIGDTESYPNSSYSAEYPENLIKLIGKRYGIIQEELNHM